MASSRRAPRDGKVEARYRDPATGRTRTARRDEYGRPFATLRDAKRWGDAIEERRSLAPDSLTVAQFLDEWQEAVAEALRPSTRALYRTLIDAYVRDRIGHVRFQHLDGLMLNQHYGELLRSGARGGRPLGAETVAKVHRLLHRAGKDAERWGYVARNPAALATPPRAPRPSRDAWSADNLARFLAHTAGESDAALWMLFATTGLRRAEALGLRWADVDLEAGTVSIRQTLAYVGARAELGEPKTSSSRRLVTIPAETITALRDHRRRQLEELLARGRTAKQAGLVFVDEHGEQLKPATVSRRFARLARDADLPRLTLHGLRHTFATLALQAGVPSKVVAEVLGHASSRTTDDIYSHVTPGMQADATAKVAALLHERNH
jgi:integrase